MIRETKPVTLYELLKRAKKGEVLFTTRPARNVTSAASKVGRAVTTQQFHLIPESGAVFSRVAQRVLRVRVIS